MQTVTPRAVGDLLRLLERELPVYEFQLRSPEMAGPHLIDVMKIGWERNIPCAIITVCASEPHRAQLVNNDREPIEGMVVQARTDSHLATVLRQLLETKLPQD